MSRVVATLCIGLAAIGVTSARSVDAQVPDARGGVLSRHVAARIDSISTAALASWNVPGMSVVVMRGPTMIVARGYGFADRETGTAATSRTVYQLGSISKQFTAAAIMRLAERGKLRLDDPVSRVLGEYRPLGDSVRLRHLLHQTSGIREEFTLPRYGTLIEDTTRQNAELLAMIMREPLGFAAGSRWSYSNSNYALLAAIIERTTGRPYDRYLSDAFFEPLGLSSLHHCAPLPTAPHHARGYVLRDGSIEPSPPENMEWIRGDGGLCASAEDLARWARALAAGRALSAASYRRMSTSTRLTDGTTPDYGFALSLVPLDGNTRRVSHGGRMAGFTGVLAHYPDHDLTVAVLTNRGGLWLESVEQAITRAVLGMPRPPVRDDPTTASLREALVGEYDVGITGMTVTIADRDGRLWLQWPPPGPTSALRYQGGRTFAAALEPDALRVTFEPAGRDERIDRIVVLMAGMHWYGRRIGSAGKR